MSSFQNRVSMVAQFSAVAALLGITLITSRPWNAARLAGLVIAVPALVLLVTARLQLGSSFSVTPQARRLVTHGIYSKIRNPMYVFSALYIAGLILYAQRFRLLLILVVLIPIQMIRAGQEAKTLEASFGDAYRKYREQTWF
jgi:protein-S-isoprenylcysteine O-methyltransferase Ste14